MQRAFYVDGKLLKVARPAGTILTRVWNTVIVLIIGRADRRISKPSPFSILLLLLHIHRVHNFVFEPTPLAPLLLA